VLDNAFKKPRRRRRKFGCLGNLGLDLNGMA